MRLRVVLLLTLAIFCLSFGNVFAQDEAGSLGSLIDQRAAVNGLPSGDGQVSAAENAVATAISDEITSFDQGVRDFEQASPANSAWVDTAEQTVQQFSQKIGGDPRAQAISDAVAQYGQDAERVQAQAPNDPRAQAISDAVAQYGNEPVIDPRGQAISDAVAQYGNDSSGVDPRAQAISDAVAQYGKESADPRAQAISDAVAQYGQEIAQTQGKNSLSTEDQQRVTNTVRESANEYIDQAGVKRPGISKRHINHLIQFMVPNAMLPTNGYWRVLPFSMTTSGQCVNLYGDNDGPSGNGQDDPGQPLCGYANAGALPYILWQSNDIPYLPGSSSIYSQMPSEDFAIVRDSGGASTGTVKTTMTAEYEVVAPDKIHVHLLIQEAGGCSMSADYTIELVTADEAVCPALPNISTPEPPTEPPIPVQEGPYQVGLPIINDKTQCNATNSPPDFDEVRLLKQDDGSVVVDYGTGKQTLYFEGNGLYEFDTGMAGAMRQDITLALFGDGSGGNLSWSNNAKDGNICFVSRDLTLPGSASEVNPTPAPSDSSGTGDSESTDTSSSADAGLFTGAFMVTWTEFPGMACAADLQDKLPKFAEATITANGSDYTLDGAGTSYAVSLMGSNYSYMVFGSDNSGVVIALANGQAGHVEGSYSSFAPDGTTCMNQLDFAPKP